MATASERKSAQRSLAKEIHTGTFKPSGVGSKAREAAKGRKEQLVDKILDIKRSAFGPNAPIVTVKRRGVWNEGRARKNIQVDPDTGENHTLTEIRDYLAWITEWNDAGRPSDFHGIVDFDPEDNEYETPFYYH